MCSMVQCLIFSLQCAIQCCVQAMGFAMIASPSSARRQQSLLGANNQRSNPPNYSSYHCKYTYRDKVHTVYPVYILLHIQRNNVQTTLHTVSPLLHLRTTLYTLSLQRYRAQISLYTIYLVLNLQRYRLQTTLYSVHCIACVKLTEIQYT